MMKNLCQYRLPINNDIINLESKRNTMLSKISNEEDSLDNKRNEFNVHSIMNDVFFIQLTINYINSNRPKSRELFSYLEEILPTLIELCEVINFYYKREQNCFIIHQLILIVQTGYTFTDNSGNKVLNDLLKSMLIDLDLDQINLKDLNRMKLNFFKFTEKKAEDDNINIINYVENTILPLNRRVISSVEDLLNDFLLLMYKSSNKTDLAFFQNICAILSDISDDIYQDNEDEHDISVITARKKELKELIMNKTNEIGNLEVLLQNNKGNKLKLQQQIKDEAMKKSKIENELETIMNDERLIIS